MKSLIATLLLVPALAAAEQPHDFAYGIPLQTSGQDALQELELPRAVYEGVVHPDLADLRVFNGAGEVVAHAFRPRVTTTKEKARPLAVIRGYAWSPGQDGARPLLMPPERDLFR